MWFFVDCRFLGRGGKKVQKKVNSLAEASCFECKLSDVLDCI